MVKWLEQASQLHEMYCHDLEVMSSNLNEYSEVILDPKTSSWSVWKLTVSFDSSHSLFCLRLQIDHFICPQV